MCLLVGNAKECVCVCACVCVVVVVVVVVVAFLEKFAYFSNGDYCVQTFSYQTGFNHILKG